MFGGIRLICSHMALKDGDVRLFPESKNRSKRIHKKLVKRFGGEFKKVPAIYRMGDTLVAHPDVFHLVKQEIANARSPDPTANQYPAIAPTRAATVQGAPPRARSVARWHHHPFPSVDQSQRRVRLVNATGSTTHRTQARQSRQASGLASSTVPSAVMISKRSNRSSMATSSPIRLARPSGRISRFASRRPSGSSCIRC
jgi:hypothetical protein